MKCLGKRPSKEPSRRVRYDRAQLVSCRRNNMPFVASKMGRPPRCSSVTYRFRYAPSIRQSGSDLLAGGPFLLATKGMLFRRQETSPTDKVTVFSLRI